MKVAFASSGGLARCWVILGAHKRLAEAGVHPDVLTGSSSGALLSALVGHLGIDDAIRAGRELCRAGNRSWSALLGFDLRSWWAARDWRWRRLPVSFTLVGRWLERVLGVERLENLRRPVSVCVTHVASGAPRFLQRGALGWSVAASCSLPFAAPMRGSDGHLYADGGISANLPVRVAYAEHGADVVVALDGVTDPARCRRHPGAALVVAGGEPYARQSAFEPDVEPDYWLRMGARELARVDLRATDELLAHGYRAAGELAHRLTEDLDRHRGERRARAY
jgi:NTE family protein